MGKYLLQHNVKMEKEISKLHIRIFLIFQVYINIWYSNKNCLFKKGVTFVKSKSNQGPSYITNGYKHFTVRNAKTKILWMKTWKIRLNVACYKNWDEMATYYVSLGKLQMHHRNSLPYLNWMRVGKFVQDSVCN